MTAGGATRWWWALGGLAALSLLTAWAAERGLAGINRQVAARREQAAALQPDLDRLSTYLRAERRLRAAWSGVPDRRAPEPAAILPPGCPPPAESEVKRAAPLAGWTGVSASLRWPALPATNALAVLAAYTAATPPWQVEALTIEAADAPGMVAMTARFAIAEPQ